MFKRPDHEFKKKYDTVHRSKESAQIRAKYPDRVPVICEVHNKADFGGETPIKLDKSKYLVPSDLTAVQFLYVIRKRLKLTPEKAAFLFVGDKNSLLTSGQLMSEVYQEYADEDGFIYTWVSSENSFGC